MTRQTTRARVIRAGLARARHKWPLHAEVMVGTLQGYVRGKVIGYHHNDQGVFGVSVGFPYAVAMSAALSKRFIQEVPFRSLKRVPAWHPYGRTKTGELIVAPAGWRILPEGEPVPKVHRECTDDGVWCSPRRFHSTMTPWTACSAGYVRAIAVPV